MSQADLDSPAKVIMAQSDNVKVSQAEWKALTDLEKSKIRQKKSRHS